ncbi:response regulator [Gimesia algae]|uniref:Response regulator receiver domain protein n=1 Tax=Gimesia algae TaxID=2527971 RepID=A0A517V8H6_9PLAN|nr:response regulator [Gimesia algae]QDT89303.1 Response regulator receiver domain protein [Gimesia algae]
MTKRVLSVGQCVPDTSSIIRFLTSNFDVEIDQADVESDTLEKLKSSEYDLVLINRKLDADYSDGIELIQKIKATSEVKSSPLMLVSNYPEYQEQAVEVGAVYGIGKDQYRDPQTTDRLQPYLG